VKRILLVVVALAAVALAAVWLWPHPSVPANGADNSGPSALSPAEQAAFLPLVCGGAGAGSGGYAHSCASLTGYPTSDYGGAGLGLGLTLTSVAYGDFTGPDQAYVSYQGSFEPHASNFGGGMLFTRSGTGWALSSWVPGNAMDGCTVVNPQGATPFICVRGSTGQGETDTVLGVWNVTSASPARVLLRASDLRGTMDPEANCGPLQPGQAVLLGIDSVTRAGGGFSAQVEYVPANMAQPLCAEHKFEQVTPIVTFLPVSADATQVSLPVTFAPAP
jgi:hypothetical protein